MYSIFCIKGKIKEKEGKIMEKNNFSHEAEDQPSMSPEEISTLEKEREKVDKETALRNWNENKVSLANNWIDNENVQMSRSIVKGAVFMCDLGENIGSEQNGLRPVLVVSNDRMNQTSGNVKVIPLSKRLKTKVTEENGRRKTVPRFYSHYFLYTRRYPFLALDSAVKVEELTTVNKVRLQEYLGNVSAYDLKKINVRIKWVFDI